MTLHEKLARLTELSHKSAVSRRAGLHPTTLWRIIKTGQSPSVDVALALAKALCVDPGWLIDDARQWPPAWTNAPETSDAKVA
jgi:hypothetical protein